MRILFVFKSENFLAPLGLCAISAIALKTGHESFLCESNSQEPLKRVKELKPDMVAYSSSTGEAKHYIKINRQIKEKFPEIFSIMGGPHSTFHEGILEEGALDAVCVGEGEGAFEDLLINLSSGKKNFTIPNIMTPGDRGAFTVRELIDDLDTIPIPDYGLLYNNTPMGKYPLKSVITSRGCPYSCAYCFNHAWRRLYKGKGRTVRRHSVDYVINDILHIKKNWPLSFVKFYDDIFTYRADDWLRDFCVKYRERIGLPFFILSRADLMDEETVRLLKHAGCRTISMSIEAGNESIREELLDRHMTNEQIISAHNLCRKYGIHTFTNCIIGLPGTDLKHDIESLDISIRSRVDWAEFPIFFPYPKTRLGERTMEMGYYKADYAKMHTSYQYRSPLSCFTEKEKNAQMNLTVLGPVAVVFPMLRNIIVNTLIHMRHNRLYTFTYYLVKMYILRKKIYITKTNPMDSLRIFFRSLMQEWFRHETQDI